MIALHVLDSTTGGDALGMLALLATRSGGVRHHVLVLGHHDTARAAVTAGVPRGLVGCAHTMGWADPSGWRAVGRAIREYNPTHVHAWGIGAVVAATVQTRYAGARIATLATPPGEGHLRLLRLCAQRRPWVFTASSSSIARQLRQGGVETLAPSPERAGGRVVRIRPGILMKEASGADRAQVRRELGLAEADGPVLLLGGENVRGARHDFGLWAAAILLQVHPRTRVLVRGETLAGGARLGVRGSRARGFAATLPEASMTHFVPPEIPWGTLAHAADALVLTPDRPVAVGSALWAMAAGTAVVGTAIECVSELVEHDYSGLLATWHRADGRDIPRAVAARLQELLSDANRRYVLADQGRAQVYTAFRPGFMLECFTAVYRQLLEDPEASGGVTLPEEAAVAGR